MSPKYALLPQQIEESNKSITMCEEEISGLTQPITDLQRDLELMSDPYPYHTIHKVIPAEQTTTYLDILPGAGIGLLTGGVMTGSFILAACASLAGGALGLTALAVSAFIKNNWNNPIEIEYNDLPFDSVSVVYSNGVYVLIESNPTLGVYKAQFYPEVTEAEFSVTFFVKRENVPSYQEKVKELADKQSRLELKQQQLALLQRQHAGLLEAQQQNDTAQQYKSRFLPPPWLDQAQPISQNKTRQPGVR